MTTAPSLATFDLSALVGRETRLRKTASTRGGEYHGPCPVCGGKDRFRFQPAGGTDGRAVWSCRQCHERWGDAIDYAIWRGWAQTFREACEVLRLEPPAAAVERALPPPELCDPPSAAWQARATEVAQDCADALWTDAGARALRYLRERGYTEDTIYEAGLGYNAADRYDDPAVWGIEREQRVWTPRGVTIPWTIGAEVWRLNVRRPLTAAQIAEGEEKYRGPAGSSNGLYNAHNLRADRPAIIVEGELDALAVWQTARDLVTPVALGSTSGARRIRWLSRLALCPLVLVATDNDGAEKGDQAARYWLETIVSAVRWRPFLKDAGAMLEAGMDVRGWVAQGLEVEP